MSNILNIAAYRFVHLEDPAAWRAGIHAHAAACALKGTVLLASEGVNLFVAGTEAGARDFLVWLKTHEPFDGLRVKESWSESVPFGRLLVKVKPEIIRMNHPTIRPQAQRAPAVDAQTLMRWLDAGTDVAGREVVMLDTRNGFEIDQGRFRGAVDWRIDRFSDFPNTLKTRRAELEGKTVVSYCTGGIRCEKAALLMRESGVDNVWQLEGGILEYIEQTGGRHFEGACFVFDERGALDDRLAPVQTL